MKHLKPKEIKEVIIEDTKIDEPKSGDRKDGKGKWTLWNCGIKVKGNWFNAGFFKKEDMDRLHYTEKGSRVIVVFENEQYQKDGEWKTIWKWRWPYDAEEVLFLLREIRDKNWIEPRQPEPIDKPAPDTDTEPKPDNEVSEQDNIEGDYEDDLPF